MKSKNRNILIMGAGYSGQLLAKKLYAKGHNIAVINRRTASAILPDIQCDQFNTLNADLDTEKGEKLLERRLSQTKFDIVYYLIPPCGFSKQDSRLKRFLSVLESAPPSQFVYASATSVYGNHNGNLVNETVPATPSTKRGQRRVIAETEIQSFCRKHKVVWHIARVAGIYGPNRLPVNMLTKSQPIPHRKLGLYSNRIYLEDLVDILVFLGERKRSGIWNVSDNQPGLLNDVYDFLAKRLGLAYPPMLGLKALSEFYSAQRVSFWSDNKRIDATKIWKAMKKAPIAGDYRKGFELSLQAQNKDGDTV